MGTSILLRGRNLFCKGILVKAGVDISFFQSYLSVHYLMDKASVSSTEDWGFESPRGYIHSFEGKAFCVKGPL